MAVPVVLGIGLLLLGVVLMLLWRARGTRASSSGARREIVDPDVASGRKLGVAAVPEEAV